MAIVDQALQTPLKALFSKTPLFEVKTQRLIKSSDNILTKNTACETVVRGLDK